MKTFAFQGGSKGGRKDWAQFENKIIDHKLFIIRFLIKIVCFVCVCVCFIICGHSSYNVSRPTCSVALKSAKMESIS